MKKYMVRLFYSTFVTQEVEAESEGEAFDIAENCLKIDFQELQDNLERFEAEDVIVSIPCGGLRPSGLADTKNREEVR